MIENIDAIADAASDTAAAPETMDELYRDTTLRYISQFERRDDKPRNKRKKKGKKPKKQRRKLPSRQIIATELLQKLKREIDLYNAAVPKDEKLKKPQALPPSVIALLMASLDDVILLDMAENSTDTDRSPLAIYQRSGPYEGTYRTGLDLFNQTIREYRLTAAESDCREVMACLRSLVPVRKRCRNRDYVAVNNGIFDYRAKKIFPFTPDLVFTSKSRVNYNPQAQNIRIHNDRDGTDWDVESWMDELSDDPEIVHVLWQILGAIIRPNVRWNKSAWLYSESGNSGKGTFCVLARNLLGESSYASIPLSKFGQEFQLEPLIAASAIIVDENDVGTYIDRAANLKAIITNDVISINRKYKTPIAYQFFGFMIQCLNEFPKIRDRSDSLYRRQLFIPMEKCFTGAERRYIKSDYLHRKDVLEYVLYRVLNMDYYELDEPASCKLLMHEYKVSNDPTREFANEFFDKFAWDLLPQGFLFDLYIQWMKKANPSGKPIGKSKFLKELRNIVETDPVLSNNWEYKENVRVKTNEADRMEGSEPIAHEYGLVEWGEALPIYQKDSYAGFLRK